MDISVVFWNNDSATKTGGIQTSALLVSGHSYCDIGVTMKVSNRPRADFQPVNWTRQLGAPGP